MYKEELWESILEDNRQEPRDLAMPGDEPQIKDWNETFFVTEYDLL